MPGIMVPIRQSSRILPPNERAQKPTAMGANETVVAKPRRRRSCEVESRRLSEKITGAGRPDFAINKYFAAMVLLHDGYRCLLDFHLLHL